MDDLAEVRALLFKWQRPAVVPESAFTSPAPRPFLIAKPSLFQISGHLRMRKETWSLSRTVTFSKSSRRHRASGKLMSSQPSHCAVEVPDSYGPRLLHQAQVVS